MATQNPVELEGTYPLPEAQIDRFLVKLVVAYPGEEEEREIVVRDRVDGRPRAEPVADAETVKRLRADAAAVHVAEPVVDYAVRLVRATRTWAGVVAGAGPRGGISLVRAARAAALLEGRDFVTPDDVKRMALPALRHRIAPSPELELEGRDTDAILKGLLEKIEAPRR
jgi:MoxR-like ATPase